MAETVPAANAQGVRKDTIIKITFDTEINRSLFELSPENYISVMNGIIDLTDNYTAPQLMEDNKTIVISPDFTNSINFGAATSISMSVVCSAELPFAGTNNQLSGDYKLTMEYSFEDANEGFLNYYAKAGVINPTSFHQAKTSFVARGGENGIVMWDAPLKYDNQFFKDGEWSAFGSNKNKLLELSSLTQKPPGAKDNILEVSYNKITDPKKDSFLKLRYTDYYDRPIYFYLGTETCTHLGIRQGLPKIIFTLTKSSYSDILLC